MHMSDIISHLDLTIFPIVSLFIFLAVFVAVTIRAFKTRKTDINHYASLPLDGGEPGDTTNSREQSHV